LIHLGEIPIPEVQSQIVDAVLEIGPGQRAGSLDAWEVYAVPLDQEEAIVDRAQLQKVRPTWWKDDGPTLWDTGMSLSADPNDVRRIHIAAKLSFLTYLNQIREKAEYPQGDPNHPFLVVLDQGSGGAMPVRHQRIQAELALWLPLWQRVSGILCFD